MKLNKQQLNIIVNQLYTEYTTKNKEIKNKQNKLLIDKFLKSEKGKLYTEYHKVFKQDNYSDKINKFVGIKFEPYRNIKKEIEDTIVLATIDSTDLKSIIDSVKSKFKI